MNMKIETTPVMPTRPCSFCLCLQGGGVFADFNTNELGRISLVRISFDGFGACRPAEPASWMSSADSKLLLNAISHGKVGSVQVEDILRRYFRENKDLILSEALAEHDLL